eukprot:6747105-Pyramimonas_sp.AAC.1
MAKRSRKEQESTAVVLILVSSEAAGRHTSGSTALAVKSHDLGSEIRPRNPEKIQRPRDQYKAPW